MSSKADRTAAGTAALSIAVSGLLGAAAGWFAVGSVPWLLVGGIAGAGTAVMITVAGVRAIVAVPVGVGAGVGAYLGGTIVGVLCEPSGCPAFEAGAALLTGIGALVGVGLVVALATRSFDEYREGLARREAAAPPEADDSD